MRYSKSHRIEIQGFIMTEYILTEAGVNTKPSFNQNTRLVIHLKGGIYLHLLLGHYSEFIQKLAPNIQELRIEDGYIYSTDLISIFNTYPYRFRNLHLFECYWSTFLESEPSSKILLPKKTEFASCDISAWPSYQRGLDSEILISGFQISDEDEAV